MRLVPCTLHRMGARLQPAHLEHLNNQYITKREVYMLTMKLAVKQTAQKTVTATIAPIISAIQKIEERIHPEKRILANEQQEDFFKIFFTKKDDLQHLSQKEMEVSCKINNSAQEIEVTSRLDVTLHWEKIGEQASIYVDEKTKAFEGVRLKYGFGALRVKNHPHPIGMIHTQSEDIVYITIAERPYGEHELLKKIRSLKNRGGTGMFERYDYIEFPMVDLDKNPNISWLENLLFETQSGPYRIISATQKTRFKMNSIGARVKSDVVLNALYTANASNIKIGLIINKPFLIWIERENVSFPIFGAYINTPDWKNPGSLDM